MMRTKCPIIVTFLWDAFDRCDPTRSHEQKPSERMREAYRLRRMMVDATVSILAAGALVACILLWAGAPA